MANDDQKTGPDGDVSATKPVRRKRNESIRDANVGAALRSVYTETVNEAIPVEFLDLLKKLD